MLLVYLNDDDDDDTKEITVKVYQGRELLNKP